MKYIAYAKRMFILMVIVLIFILCSYMFLRISLDYTRMRKKVNEAHKLLNYNEQRIDLHSDIEMQKILVEDVSCSCDRYFNCSCGDGNQ